MRSSLQSIISFLFCCCVSAVSFAQTTRPVIPGDFADPSVIRTAKGYYAVGTSSEWAPHFPVYFSADLKSWKQVGNVFDKAPGWTAGSFWAPEYYKIGNTYYIYYTARRKSDKISCIGVATSAYPDRGFTDRGVVISFGKEAIDAFIVKDKNQLYITYKAYGLDNRPIELLAERLSADGLKAEGNPVSLLRDDERIGLEGQAILKHGNYFYLFYSAGSCCGARCSYHVRVARAKDFAGPYEKLEGVELLARAPGLKCTGHGTFVQSGKGVYYYLSHAYSEQSDIYTGRQGLLSVLSWPEGSDWPVLKAVPAKQTPPDIRDAFNGNRPGLYWQYDFHTSIPEVRQLKGNLLVGGTLLRDDAAGIFYGVRPFTDNYSITTTVNNHNSALKGLSFYGSLENALGIGVSGNVVRYWILKAGKENVLDSIRVGDHDQIDLKMTMLPDKTARVYYRMNAAAWKELQGPGKISVDFLPQWDRAPRVGLLVKGLPGQFGSFGMFELVNARE